MEDDGGIKRLLDLGVQTLLLPNVQSEEEARRAVAAVRYPPQGVRGVSTNTRANRFGRVKDYLPRANDEICLLLQVETRAAMDRIEQMAAIDGVDGLFVGPQDLAADLGHLGNPGHLRSPPSARRWNASSAAASAGLLNFNEPRPRTDRPRCAVPGSDQRPVPVCAETSAGRSLQDLSPLAAFFSGQLDLSATAACASYWPAE